MPSAAVLQRYVKVSNLAHLTLVSELRKAIAGKYSWAFQGSLIISFTYPGTDDYDLVD